MPFVRVRGSWMVKHPTASLYFGAPRGSPASLAAVYWIGFYLKFFRKIHFSGLAFTLGTDARRQFTASIYNLFRFAHVDSSR